MSRAARQIGALAAPVLGIGLGLGALGCSAAGPEYEPVELELPAAYHAPLPGLFQGEAPPGRWWTRFADESLDRLIARGLAGNLSLQVAASRVAEARAVAEGTGAQLTADASARATVRSQDQLTTSRSRLDNTNTVRTDLTAVWEFDLFGRLQRTREAALAEAAREEASRRETARVTASEIARTYIELRAAQRRLSLIRRSLELQRRTLELVERRVEAGLAPGLDQVRARAAVATLEADQGPLRAEIRALANALAVLLGQPPGALADELSAEAPLPTLDTGAAIGAPADLVRRRPDVQAAELAIVAATSRVGVATAELYPRLSLEGAVGAGVSGVGTGDVVESTVSSLSLLLNIPLLDGGARRANITAAEERVVQAALLYRETVLQALEQVEGALLAYEGARRRQESLRAAVAHSRRAYEQSRELYRQGFVNFLSVLDSQREWNRALQQLALAERDRSLEAVNLFTALGGSDEPPEGGGDGPGENPPPSP